MAMLLETFRGYRHPRVPVYEGHWDNVIGFLHSEDVMRVLCGGVDLDQVGIRDILRPAHFVPPTTKVDEMFNFFQAHNARAAIVLGEFGEVLGIVTVNDVLSFIFGEITGDIKGADEIEQDAEGFLVPGYMRLTDFHNLTSIDIDIDDPVMATIGGMVFRLFGRLPSVGDKVQHEGYDFSVLKMDGLRISRLRVAKSVQTQPEEGEAPPDHDSGLLAAELGEGLADSAAELEDATRADETGAQQ